MLYYHLGLISLAFWFPAQIAADCSACNSYAAALKSCQKTPSANVTLTSSDMDTDTVHCMCISSSSHSEINKCRGCAASDVSVGESLDFTILAAWLATCNADDLFGDDQAALCWRSQPSDYVPCVSNTGGGSGTLSGGASSSAATLPQSTSETTAATPSANAKSASPLSFPKSIPLAVMLIAFGMVIGL